VRCRSGACRSFCSNRLFELEALGVNSDYIEYMMGHTASVYHDIQSKGLEFLRNIYAAAGLSIRPKTRLSKIEMLKAFSQAIGLNPEKILTQEALSEPHRIHVNSDEREERQIALLCQALKESMKKELLLS